MKKEVLILRKRFLVLISLILLIALLATGCFDRNQTGETGSGEPSEDLQILRLNNKSEPGYLHPAKARGTHDSWIIEHVFEGLTKKAPDGSVVPGMAKDWSTEDGLTYIFNLREDVYWTNGDPVTAEDFEYAWKYVLNPATASEYAYQAYYIKGGEAYNTSEETDPAKLKELEDAVAVKAIDEKTLEVTLEAPAPYFIELLSFYTLYPVNKGVNESNPDWANDPSTYVSNGPFIFAEWKHKESVKLVKNENYYDSDLTKLDEVHLAIIEDENTAWQLYRSGELDLLYPLPPDVISQLNETNDPEFVIGDDLAVYYYNINTTKKPFTNAKIRKALAMAIDRSTITKSVSQGGENPAYTLTPPGIPDLEGDYNENLGPQFEENVEEAQRLLAEGLAEEGLDKLSFVFLYNTSELHKKVSEAVQEMWRKNLGVEVTLENVEFQVKLDRELNLDYTLSRAGWIGDYVDPMTFIDMFVTGGGNNNVGWSNKKYDELVTTAKSTADQEVRFEAMREAEKILMEEMPIIPVFYYTYPYTQKSYVKGIYKPVNRYPQFHYAYIEK
jgi:oligopeptide transport system substrate-binding protein